MVSGEKKRGRETLAHHIVVIPKQRRRGSFSQSLEEIVAGRDSRSRRKKDGTLRRVSAAGEREGHGNNLFPAHRPHPEKKKRGSFPSGSPARREGKEKLWSAD